MGAAISCCINMEHLIIGEGATSLLRVITVHANMRGGGYSDNHNTSPNLGAKPGF